MDTDLHDYTGASCRGNIVYWYEIASNVEGLGAVFSEEAGGSNMLYLVSAIEYDEKGEISGTYEPEVVVADSMEDAKLKAFARWGVKEADIDRVVAHVLCFTRV